MRQGSLAPPKAIASDRETYPQGQIVGRRETPIHDLLRLVFAFGDWANGPSLR